MPLAKYFCHFRISGATLSTLPMLGGRNFAGGTQLLAASIKQVGLVAQPRTCRSKSPSRGDLNRLRVLERLIPHEKVPAGHGQNKSVLIDPLVACKASFPLNRGRRANLGCLVLQFEGLVPRGHRVPVYRYAGERTILLQGFDKFFSQEGAVQLKLG